MWPVGKLIVSKNLSVVQHISSTKEGVGTKKAKKNVLESKSRVGVARIHLWILAVAPELSRHGQNSILVVESRLLLFSFFPLLANQIDETKTARGRQRQIKATVYHRVILHRGKIGIVEKVWLSLGRQINRQARGLIKHSSCPVQM
jgi:hypothetical protein